jgi:hypothetical protein
MGRARKVTTKESYIMIQKWLQRLDRLFHMHVNIWLGGDYLMVGDDKYYNKKVLGLTDEQTWIHSNNIRRNS